MTDHATGSASTPGSEWTSRSAGVAGALLLYVTVSGLLIFAAPFSAFTQINVIAHTLVGFILLAPVGVYLWRHWKTRRGGNLSHHQLTGYASVALLALCIVSGLVVTWQGVAGPRMSHAWSVTHLLSGAGFAFLTIVHLATIIVRRVRNPSLSGQLRRARRVYYVRALFGATLAFGLSAVWALAAPRFDATTSFDPDYNWRFGPDRPFAPSLARVSVAGSDIQSNGAIDPRALAGSAGCATSGCHTQIYEEWLPSAHRYSSLDDMFQRVQTIMAQETSPEHTRYCAGCHDPISLFSGAKNASNITLSAEGSHEGISCLTCHSIVQTDMQGNGDYTIEPQPRYLYELGADRLSGLLSDFLIRTYPDQHVRSYSRALYKTPEFCGACHKQYVDREVNTDIGKVQGQNQYDSWKNSRWHDANNPSQTISCRECHMPLVASVDPARGDQTDANRSLDDRMHRSHRTLGSNQYIPLLHDLPGAQEHVRLTEAWLRGEIAIPEIADRWTEGRVVEMAIDAPETVRPGENVAIRVLLFNNKTGHDFPTGPLDMIESWLEVVVRDEDGQVIHHEGGVDAAGSPQSTPMIFKADGFDRQGELIDRHNLWDLVGASYKRSLYPGMHDTAEVEFQCPSMARGRLSDADAKTPGGQRSVDRTFATVGATGELTIEATLWYRKANPEFLDRVYGVDAEVRSPATAMSNATARIRIVPNDQAETQ